MSLDDIMREFYFPKVSNAQTKTIADEIEPVVPRMDSPPILETYKDHMGNNVTVYENGSRTIHSYDSTHLYGESGHSFGRGFYVVNGNGEMVFANEEGYNELVEKCRPYWQVLKGLQEKFKGYRVEPSRGDRLTVNDKIIKGILVYPGMRMKSVESVIEGIAEFIQSDIDKGRIVKGKYGI